MSSASDASGIVLAAQRAVAGFEGNPQTVTLQQLLESWTREGVEKVAVVQDPLMFAARMYDLVRRLEAAAAMYSDQGNPYVILACALVRKLIESIRSIREAVNRLIANTELEKAGKEYLLERLGWGLRILEDQLAVWGY